LPHYFFRIQSGTFSGASDVVSIFPDDDAAWAELTKVSGDLLRSISRKMKPNTSWEIALLNEARKPIFKISLIGEAVAEGHFSC